MNFHLFMAKRSHEIVGVALPLKTYATIALADPKAPFEFRAMGPAIWAAQVSAITAGLYIVDPLRLRHGEGLDEIWFSGYNPFYWPVSEKLSDFGDWLFDDDEQPTLWDYW